MKLLTILTLSLLASGCVVHSHGPRHRHVAVETDCHHDDHCGHYYWRGGWHHSHGHRHFHGCGHHFRSGMWIRF
jgi:hypothetical protein